MMDSEERRRDRFGSEPGWIDGKFVLLNLYITQGVVLLAGVGILLWQGRLTLRLFTPERWDLWLIGVTVGLAVVGVDLLISRMVPAEWVDDGGLNRLLFQDLSIPHIGWVAAWVALAEELLFRGGLQYWLGVVGTSVLFALIHVRYLKKGVMILLLFLVSLVLGWLTEWSGSLAPAIAAHFTLDFVLGVLIRLDKMPVQK